MGKKIKKELAAERIKDFFDKAEKLSSQELAQKYVKKAKRTAMRFNIKLPREERKKFCRKCCSFFTAYNCAHRVKHGFLVIRCFNCNTSSKYKIEKATKIS